MNDPRSSAGSANTDPKDIIGIARGGGLNVAGGLFTQIMRFVITLLVARLLGPTEAGIFFLGFAVLMVLDQLATGGFVLSLTRFVAMHRADDDDAALRGTVRLGLATSSLVAVALAIGLFAFAPWVAARFSEDPAMVSVLRWIAFTLPATAFTDVALSATQGFKTMRPYAKINLFFEPAARLTLTALLLAQGFGLSGAVAALFVTNVVAAVLSAVALRRLLGPSRSKPTYDVRNLFAYTGVGWLSNLASNWLLWADTLLLGLYGTPAEVSVYQVSSRIALLAAVVIGPLATSFAPHAADLYRRGFLDRLERAYKAVTSWTVRLYLPAFVFLMLFSREVLAIFGPAFVTGVPVVLILSAAQLVNTSTGPCGYVLTMSGHISAQLVLNVTALATNIGLNLILIPRYGMVGAAIAWGVCIAVFNIARVIYVWKLLGMTPFESSLSKAVAAAAVAAVCGMVVAVSTSGPVSLVVGGVTIFAVYFPVLFAFGIRPDDRVVLTWLGERLRGGNA